MDFKGTGKHPIDRANIISKLFFIYNYDTFKRGINESWTVNNLYSPRSSDKSEFLGKWMICEWKKHVKDCSISNKKPNILKVIWIMFWSNILFDGAILLFSQIVLKVGEPILLGSFLQYFKPNSSVSKDEMTYYGIVLIFMIGIRTIAHVHYKIRVQMTGLKIKIACSYLIYNKVLQLNAAVLRHVSNGNVLNLISNDLNRLDFTTNYLHYLWASPLFVLCIFYLLYIEIGVPGIIGMIWLAFIVCIQSYSSKLTGKYRVKVARKSDKRIRILDEIIGGINVIKLYAWEKPFSKLLSNARNSEMKEIKKAIFLRAGLQAVMVFVNSSTICVVMLTMVYLNHEITASKIFSLVIYFGALNFTISLMFTLALQKSVELYESFKRINTFLNMDEKIRIDQINQSIDRKRILIRDVCVQSNNQICGSDGIKKGSKKLPLITVTEASDILHDINLEVNDGEILSIVGTVGSGKSCLLQTILGEATISSGSVKVFGEISYASQEPWIFVATIRENILFGENFDSIRYQKVIDACQLTEDFKQLPLGDLTIVNERGVSLSGGQRARINLARAVYRNVDIYLLDDPFSAVDIPIAKKIYEKCVIDLLQNKTVVLVTHHLEYLQKTDKVALINSGSVEICDSFINFVNSKTKFINLITEEVFNEHKSPHQSMTNSLNGKTNTTQKNNSKKIDPDRIKQTPLLLYLASGSSKNYIIMVLLFFVIVQISITSVDLYMGYWTFVEEFRNVTEKPKAILWTPMKSLPLLERSTYSYIYLILLAFFAAVSIFKVWIFGMMTTRSSKKLHSSMLKSVMESPLKFFETNSSGQILNRFSTDLTGIDEAMPRNIMESVNIVLTLSSRLVIVSILKPFLVFIIFLLYGLLSFGIKYFTKTSRNLKRVKSELMSPILTHLNISLQGIASIRALKAENYMTQSFSKYLDCFTSSWFMFGVTTSSFSLFVETICFIFITIVTLSFLLMGNEIGLNPSEIGLAITQSIMLTTAVQYGIIQIVETSYQLVSVERIQEYINLPKEFNPISPKSPPANWPQHGNIMFKEVYLKYNHEDPMILKNISFNIKPLEKIGIVGRTGSGKSSIIAALCKTACTYGKIEIDNLDIDDIELPVLRQKISVIPQNPVLFSGTLRFNLDPFGTSQDVDLYRVLQTVELSDLINRTLILDEHILDGGYSYSVGQKQLICLARAILRKSKIVLLDEATASIDPQTDAIIQKVIRRQFSESTVLTIAHRLNTVMDSDKIMVVDNGQIIEFDNPQVLLQNSGSKLYEIMSNTNYS